MGDASKIGTKFEPVIVPVEAGQLKFFAKATGETNPVYTDEAAAKAAVFLTPVDCVHGALAFPERVVRFS